MMMEPGQVVVVRDDGVSIVVAYGKLPPVVLARCKADYAFAQSLLAPSGERSIEQTLGQLEGMLEQQSLPAVEMLSGDDIEQIANGVVPAGTLLARVDDLEQFNRATYEIPDRTIN